MLNRYVLAGTSLAVLALAGAGTQAVTASSADPLGAGHASLVQLQRELGYLPIGNAALYEQSVQSRWQQWLATHPVAAAEQAAATSTPKIRVNVAGQNDSQLAPGDPTGAAGPSSYIQFINDKMAIYSRTGQLLSEAGTGSFAQPDPTDTHYSDPQILWDAASNRFYYTIIDTNNDTFAWGFSKTSNPTSVTTGFCNYNADFGYGGNLPDYPKLGQSNDFLLIGANIYDVEAYVGSDIDWISKPQGAGSFTSCPSASAFKKGQVKAIKNSDGQSFASDPNPAQQADPSSTGWIVAVPDESNSGATGNFLTIFKVTKNSNGTANIPSKGTKVTVPAFAPPPPAPQKGSNFVLDTLDGRLTRAVSAIDPSRSNANIVYTGHTIAGGAGAEYRWYAINVGKSALAQPASDVTDSSLFVFNGAVAPDRLVQRTSSGFLTKFGSSQVIGFTTSSSTALPADQMVSKRDASAAQSAFVLVHRSSGPDSGFECTQNPVVPNRCRWGDYAGAASDPGAPATAGTGQVWLTNMWSDGSSTPNEFSPTWGTQIWEATP